MFGVSTDLNTPHGCCGAHADVEESCAASLALTRLAGCPAQVDDQGFVLKQAHKMRGFMALSDTNLCRHSSRSKSSLGESVPEDLIVSFHLISIFSSTRYLNVELFL